jgi:cyclophilin family peptidyl-prolyl cis-trans isomerase/HEAT repeat protein
VKYNVIFLLAVLHFFACSADTDQKNIDQILLLGRSRNKTPHIFDEFLHAESEVIRLQVAKSIANIQDEVHVTTLKKLLKDQSKKIVRKTIFALGQISGNESSNVLKNLLVNDDYRFYQRDIIQALGQTKEKSVIQFLITSLPTMEDSLISYTIKSITFLSPPNEKDTATSLKIKSYLNNNDERIRTAAVYFFSRNPDISVIKDLIRVRFNSKSIGYKFKLKALDKVITSSVTQNGDSSIYDSLKTKLLQQVNEESISWRTKFYQIALLSNFTDSLVLKTLSRFLQDQNPHIRLQTISAICKFEHLYSKNILLNYYNTASWLEKGEIIYALVGKDLNLVHRLIQQNLDQGTIYFKQLLLKSLAKIKNRSAIRQLRQFLNVPTVRLKFTAFNELAKLNSIRYRDAKDLLLSGDEVLVTIAASWIANNPKYGVPADLENSYSQFSEPEDLDVMLTILEALDAINDKKSIEFLIRIIEKTKSKSLAQRVSNILAKFEINIPIDKTLVDSLYIPPTTYTQIEPILATITTKKGDINIELWPNYAPLTVTNFINLAEKGFYNNSTFHRVVGDFVIQGGDPRGDGWGGPSYKIPCEYNEHAFQRGSVGMATAGKDTGGSQFFICHSEQPHLNRRYTLFGRIISGIDIVDIIEIDDEISKISIQKRGAL